jgi:hypothetical protein
MIRFLLVAVAATTLLIAALSGTLSHSAMRIAHHH